MISEETFQDLNFTCTQMDGNHIKTFLVCYKMELVVDNRERELLKFFGEVQTANLDLGDFVIRGSGEIVYVIERKSWKDLAESIKDGRYHNQKKRLLETYDVSKIIYIFEGPWNFGADSTMISGIPKPSLISCLINTALRDGIKVFVSGWQKDTYDLVMGIYNRVRDNPEKYVKALAAVEAAPAEIQVVKKQCVDAESYFIAALCQIPGVSMKTAKAIAMKYRSFPILIKELSTSPEKMKLLKEITTEDSKGGKRRISEKVVKAIVDYIFGHDDSC